ncbi:MAG: serine acetyltransferase [Fimbriimonadaceae bacterium]|nr:serine acetyltransferase [Fimbriimonadaceae bacterium]
MPDFFEAYPVPEAVIANLLPLYSTVAEDRPDAVGPDLPHRRRVIEAFELLKAALLPGGMSPEAIQPELLHLFLAERLSRAFRLFAVEISRALTYRWRAAFVQHETRESGRPANEIPVEHRLAEGWAITHHFFETLPAVRAALVQDITAAYLGDPAAMSYAEVMLTYPGLHAVAAHRIAHELYKLDVPLVPRVISEYTHATLGIDIHPGAQIGRAFFVDHATGVVIGETARVGDNVKLYQGVTLGAKSFPLDAKGHPQKRIQRHPTVEDDVVIYSNASILGPITIGRGSEIGANVFLTRDVPPGSQVRTVTQVQSRLTEEQS